MRLLTVSELIYINGRVVKNDKIATGKQKVRDLDLLEAAAARPSTSAFGQDAYPALADKVAALLHSVARNHPFADGNKRTAIVAAIFMFEVNGEQVHWAREEALAIILDVAEGRKDWDALAAWFPTRPGDTSPEPDAARDMAAIDRIIDQHRWLLHELEQR
jgi:death-on-curing protein